MTSRSEENYFYLLTFYICVLCSNKISVNVRSVNTPDWKTKLGDQGVQAGVSSGVSSEDNSIVLGQWRVCGARHPDGGDVGAPTVVVTKPR